MRMQYFWTEVVYDSNFIDLQLKMINLGHKQIFLVC